MWHNLHSTPYYPIASKNSIIMLLLADNFLILNFHAMHMTYAVLQQMRCRAEKRSMRTFWVWCYICMDRAISKKICLNNAMSYLVFSQFYITYHESMMIIVEAMLATVQEEFHITDEQIECFYNKFMSKLPESMQRLLQANWEIYLLKYTVFKDPLWFSMWEVWVR